MSIQDKLPSTYIYTLEEVRDLVLRDSLRRLGVEDPDSFVAANDVRSLPTFRLNANVMALTVLSSTPLPPPKELDSAASLPVSK